MTKKEILETINRYYLEAKEKSTYYLDLSIKYPNEKYWDDEARQAREVWYTLYCLVQEIYK